MTPVEEVAAVRTQLWDAGFRPVPVHNAVVGDDTTGKNPLGNQWQLSARKNPPLCAFAPAVAHALNTGILCDGLRPIDLDIDDPDLARACRDVAMQMFGETPIRSRAGSARCLLLYRAAEGEPQKRTLTGSTHGKGTACKIEVLGKGQQFVAFGQHYSGTTLEWFPDAPGGERSDSLTPLTEDQIQAFLVACAQIIDAPSPTKPNGRDPHVPGDLQANLLRVAAALHDIPNAGPADWENWNRVCMAVFASVGGDEAGRALMIAWSARNPAYDPQETNRRWDHYRTSPPDHIGAGTIFFLAQEARKACGAPSPEPSPGPPHPEEVFPPGVWEEGLLRTDRGIPKQILANAMHALRGAPDWQGLFGWNDFTVRPEVNRPLPGHPEEGKFPRNLTDVDVSFATEWLQRQQIDVRSSVTREAVYAIASQNRRHPVREYLHRLTWDGENRLDFWLSDHFGVDDCALHRAYARRWLIGMVARIEDPGCQMDTMLILEGRQGLRKSTGLRALVGSDWFTDHIPDLASKDAQLQLQGMWLIELAELSAWGKVETAKLKAFTSQPVDHFRTPYGHMPAKYPRQCGFAGTVNPGGNGYLRDETGARRFWIVACGDLWERNQKVDMKGLSNVRDHLWAEALHRYRAQEPWWLDTDELELLQTESADERREDDPRERKIKGYIQFRERVHMDELLGEQCLNIPTDRWNQSTAIQIGRVMKMLGWTRKRMRPSMDYFYTPPED